jgi:membrane protein DedA with SNARE-associated domain
MPRRSFLLWNGLAALVSTAIAALGAYGIGAALVGQLSARRGVIALAVAAVTLVGVAIAGYRRRQAAGGTRRSSRTSSTRQAGDRSGRLG